MAKYLRKKEKKRGKWLVLTLVLVIAVLALLWMLPEEEMPSINLPTQANQETRPVTEPQKTVETQQTPAVNTEPEPIVLADELRLLMVSDYAGMYMEDGTNEVVTDVMMILVENTSEKDLQLARINLEYETFTAEFEVTNLPAGEKLVALEKNRHSAVTQQPQAAEVQNIVFFQEPMSIREETFRISGGNGLMEVENISGEDITGDIYIYYKNSASDILYGGITYRVVLRGGVVAGDTAQVLAGHYSPDTTRILSVVYGE